MLFQECSFEFQNFAAGLIRRKARQLLGKYGFGVHDLQEIQQTLVVRLLLALQSFDPTRSNAFKFSTAVVERAVASIVRDRQAQKRNQETRSLAEPDQEHTTLGESLDQHCDQRRNDTRSDQERLELAMDVAEVLARLPDELRRIAELRMSNSTAEVARILGVPRTTINERLKDLHGWFYNAGLEEYLT